MNTVHYIPPGNSPQVISNFEGQYEFLSNFYPCRIDFGFAVFKSSEQAYQYHKLARSADRIKILTLNTPGQAKRYGNTHDIYPGWDDLRTGVMLTVLLAKFQQNVDLKMALALTGKALIIEGNTWGDVFWGCEWQGEARGGWVGENHLGRLLMIIRDALL